MLDKTSFENVSMLLIMLFIIHDAKGLLLKTYQKSLAQY